jgi:hypothetical protein
MKPAANIKSSNGTKSSSEVEGGVLKRLPIKKIYCTKCKKLIKGKIQTSADIKQIICPICNLHLRVWKSTAWTSLKSEVFIPA